MHGEEKLDCDDIRSRFDARFDYCRMSYLIKFKFEAENFPQCNENDIQEKPKSAKFMRIKTSKKVSNFGLA